MTRRQAFCALWLPGALLLLGLGVLSQALAPEVPEPEAEALRARAAYVGSGRCRSCHAEHYASWFASYHRRMTAPANSAELLGTFDGSTLAYGGVLARLDRDALGWPRLRVKHPDQPEQVDRIERTVGSHRFQQYLAVRDGTWQRLPVAWDAVERRFVHMNTAFLTPDPARAEPGAAVEPADYERHVTRWNDNCIYCHNTAPSAGLDPRTGSFDSQVAELGIACEACHGPGSEHVRRNRNPLHRYLSHLGRRRDRSVANPARMTTERASQVCGRCHGQRMSPDIARVHQQGDRYVPGEDLGRYSTPLSRDTTLDGERVFTDRFWPDGTPRLTAYEYQGLLQSPCHARGELQCESCHTMHGPEPRMQLREGHDADGACVGCHAELAPLEARARHSRHGAESPGARCGACHMPRIVYGLAGVRISHRIERPDPESHAAQGRPDACTLCHLDRSQAWAAVETERLWARDGALPAAGAPGPTQGPLEGWAGSRIFGGDPIERATAAAALGNSHAAPGLSGAVRVGLLLEAMAGDRYPAVRKIAWRSLRSLVRQASGAEGALDDDAFDPGELPPERTERVERLARTQLGSAQRPEANRVAWLRQRAAQHAISIGE